MPILFQQFFYGFAASAALTQAKLGSAASFYPFQSPGSVSDRFPDLSLGNLLTLADHDAKSQIPKRQFFFLFQRHLIDRQRVQTGSFSEFLFYTDLTVKRRKQLFFNIGCYGHTRRDSGCFDAQKTDKPRFILGLFNQKTVNIPVQIMDHTVVIPENLTGIWPEYTKMSQ